MHASSAPQEGRVSLRAHLRRILPTGHVLPPPDWLRRHRQICRLLWAHVVALPLFAVAIGRPLDHSAVEISLVAAFTLAAHHRGFTNQTRAAAATLGLMTSSAVVTHLSGGMVEAHFHFFVMVVVVSLYQSWRPFLLALGFVLLHHGMVGVLAPDAVYNHPAALANPWLWALVHALFIGGQAIACLVAWRVNEDALVSERAARAASERANRDLAESQALSNVGSWDWDLVSGAVWWSGELYRIAGFAPDAFVPGPESFLALVHPDERPRVTAILDSVHTDGYLDFECRVVRGDGQHRSVHVRGQSITVRGRVVKLIGTCQDITDRKALEAEIEHRAFHDTLTGLGNRALFLSRVDHALALRERTGAAVTVLYLDLDDFKSINDTLGHAWGDNLLVEVARRLQLAVRDCDTISRLGGDEFGILLEDIDSAAATTAAERIGHQLQAPVVLDGKPFSVRTSIGIVTAGAGTRSAELMRDADIAMYAAKRDHDSGYQLFAPEMLSTVVTRMELKSDLTAALARDQFVLHYQPVTNLQTGQLRGVEALVRWNHPERGLIPPGQFIPLAEETGKIVALGEWVLGAAARQAVRFQAQLGQQLTLSVNVAAQQLETDLVATVRTALAQAHLDPRHLVLEITETSLMHQDDAVLVKLAELRALGVRVAIDDFGTGYSSLAYLQSLPVDILKIDRSFIDALDAGEEQSALVQSIVQMGQIFNLETVAEGIETDEQAATVQAFGCDLGQGYHFCPPRHPDQLVEELRHWARPEHAADEHAPERALPRGTRQAANR